MVKAIYTEDRIKLLWPPISLRHAVPWKSWTSSSVGFYRSMLAFLCCLLVVLCLVYILCVLQATEMFLYFNRFFRGLWFVKTSEIKKEIFFFIMWHVYCDFCFEVICFELKHACIHTFIIWNKKDACFKL